MRRAMSLYLNDVEENYREAGHEILVRILGKRRHDIYSFPNFVISIYFPLLAKTQELAHRVGVKNLHAFNHLRDFSPDLVSLTFSSPALSRNSEHRNRRLSRRNFLPHVLDSLMSHPPASADNSSSRSPGANK